MKLSYLDLMTTDPSYNLAMEQYVFDCLPRDRMYFMLWQNDNAIIVGKYQNTIAEINEEAVRERGIRVVRRLSGGNVQKVLVGREIESAPNVIITAYPVRGLDVNSAYTIYDILNEQKLKGTGILFIGEDLDVMLALCDKIMVLCHGKNMGIVHADKTTKEELGLMMTGSLDLTEEKKEKNFGIAKDSNLTEEQWEKVKEEEAAENE